MVIEPLAGRRIVEISRQRTKADVREGETATLLSRYLLIFGGLGGGFAPR
ncbi:MAG: hypothetical protein H0X15_06435 [Acidobacteria bacterium]|nr:hypothetical protein [Acidobacteriota bacterium]MBA4122394.1 hypothetical protein [Acidobacteriota bacterium]